MDLTHGPTAAKRNDLAAARIRGPGPGVAPPSQLTGDAPDARSSAALPGLATSALRRPATTPVDLAALPVTFAAPLLGDRGRVQLTVLGRQLGWKAGAWLTGIADPELGTVTFAAAPAAVMRVSEAVPADAEQVAEVAA